MRNQVLQVEGLTKRYKRATIGPLDFAVERGIVSGLVGANGSGKSTLLRLLMNIIAADRGEIKIFGQNWNGDESKWKEAIGYAGELLDAYYFLNITELKQLISRWHTRWDEERFTYFLERYKIDANQKFGKCSKGTKKKIEFIFALCHNPSLLLLDEPSAGVDITSRRKMKEDLVKFMEDGEKSLLIATHAIDEINQLCDEIIILDNGQIKHIYNKDAIHEQWARIFVSTITEKVKMHPNVLQTEMNPYHVVTNDRFRLEKLLMEEKIAIRHMERLGMEEVMEYLMEHNGEG